MRIRSFSTLLALSTLVLWTEASSLAQSAPALVTGFRSTTLSSVDAQTGVVRRRLADVNLGPLGGTMGALPVAHAIRLNLLPGVDDEASLDRLESSRWGLTWIGRIGTDPLSSVVISVVNGNVSGFVLANGHHYDLQSSDGAVIIQEIDDRLLSGDDAMQPRAVDEPREPESTVRPGDDPRFVDVLALYTPAVKASLGGEAAVQARLQTGVAIANTVYGNSGITTRLRLVCAAETDYAETGDLQKDLQRLTTASDGYLDDVETKRNECGADLVTLVVDRSNDSYCGYAWVGTEKKQSPFSTITRGCVAATTFAHEIGHNFGLQHDWYMTAKPGAYSYAHGFVDLTGGVIDVMAYYDMCADAHRDCIAVPYFANPGLTYRGRPLGIREGTSTACTAGNLSNPPCDSDAVRTINNMTPFVANLRYSKTATNTLAFPPRSDTFAFREMLNATYRDQLHRAEIQSDVDAESAVVWTQEYLMYRAQACSHAEAVEKVRVEIAGVGLPPVCGAAPGGEVRFPPRNETLAFRRRLESIFRLDLQRPPVTGYVDLEGDVVWVQEYLRYRVNGCSNSEATANVMTQIGGGAAPPVCSVF